MHSDQPTLQERDTQKAESNGPRILHEAKQDEPRLKGEPPEKKDYPTIVSALDLALQDLKPVEFIVDKIVPVGLTFLAGAPKAGKSILTVQISLAVGNGLQVFDSFGTTKSEALLISLEDGFRTIQNRLVGMSKKFPPCPSVHIATKWGKSFDENLNKMEKYLLGNTKIRLVIIDTFALFCGSSKKGTYESEYKITHDIKKLADLHGVAILAIHHILKTIRGDWISGLYGSHGFVAAADSVLYFERSRGAKQAKLNVTGRNIEDDSINLKFDSEKLVWIIDDGNPNIELQPERRQILDLLISEKRPMRLSEIANRIGKSTTNTQNLLKKLLELNLVNKVGQGVYVASSPKKSASAITAERTKPAKSLKSMETMDSMDTSLPTSAMDQMDSMDSMDFRYLWS